MFEDLVNKQACMAIIGLGYVGLPLALAFAQKIKVIGYDVNQHRIEQYKSGIDRMNIASKNELLSSSILFTSDRHKLKEAHFYIVAVPTPVDEEKKVDLSMVIQASADIGANMRKGAMVVYESTVYPGATEDICIKILEQESGLKCGRDFKVGYSPERINPGDKIHSLSNITKIVAGIDDYTVNEIEKVYNLIVKNGVYKVSSIMTAESVKIIENSQRDVNIAFMNEMAMLLHKLNINSNEVFEAMKTKWNSLNFQPGLVGGHCIGVDSYYLIEKAQEVNFNCDILKNSRAVNESVIEYVAEEILSVAKQNKINRVAVMGITFKENCSDIRNSRAYEIINTLRGNNIEVMVCDPVADRDEVRQKFIW